MSIRAIIILVATLLTTSFGVYLTVSATLELRETAELSRDGVPADVTVSQKWIVLGETVNNSHRIRYSFELDGVSYTFDRPVPVIVHRVLSPGSAFGVTVLPRDPDLHEIFPGQLASVARSKLIAGLIVAGVGALLFILGGGIELFRRKQAEA